MKRAEARLEREILLALGRVEDLVLFKNEVGVGYRGALAGDLRAALAPFGPEVVAAALAALGRNRITYGLGEGSPDLVGAVAGRALGLELKRAAQREGGRVVMTGGRLSDAQERWHHAARDRGGWHVEVVDSVDSARAAIERARQ